MGRRHYLQRAGLALWHAKVALMYGAAFVWRRLLFRTTFVAITGSVGKTTAKQCLAAALASRFPTVWTFANQNDYSGVPRTLLRVRFHHRFAVLELAGNGRGLMQRSARLVRPDVAVVLAVARTHMKEFRTLDNTAAEKARLLAALRPGGIAVLNGDDPRVAAMSGSVKQRIVWFGSAPAFDLWAEELSSRWPERFSLRVHSGAECQLVQTQLIGTHWKNSVLGALAASQICGVTLAEAAEAMRRVEPVPGRMQPVRLPSGAVIIRDEYNGSIDTLQKALQFLAEARAGRRILVFSDMTDFSQRPRDRIARVAKEAARFTGCVVFLGEHAKHGVRAAISAGMPPENVHGFMGFEAAVAFLRAELRPGDLVLLRSRFCDDLSRLYFGLIGTVDCRKTNCDRMVLCDLCPELGARPDPVVLVPAASIPASSGGDKAEAQRAASSCTGFNASA
jgi:UDP-N-acetylmuramoyl-tripeptide--D-alanyl-D-alanine ligase